MTELKHITNVQFVKESEFTYQITIGLMGKDDFSERTSEQLRRLDELLGEMKAQNNNELIHGLIVALETYLKK